MDAEDEFERIPCPDGKPGCAVKHMRRRPLNGGNVPSLSDSERVKAALDLLTTYGHTDGSHHKAWIVDHVARILAGDGYEEWVHPLWASWDEGIMP